MAYSLVDVEFRQSQSVSANVTDPHGIAFNDDGSKLYVADFVGDQIDSYTLTDNYDITTASHNNTLSADEPRSVLFNDDGSKIYVIENINLQVQSWSLSTNYDISSSSASETNTLDVNPQTNNPTGMAWNDDGSALFVNEGTDDEVEEYTLSTPYDLSSASHDTSHDISSQDTTPQEIDFNSDGTKMFITGYNNDAIFESDLLNQYDPSSASVTETLDVSSETTTPFGGKWADSGTKFYVASESDDTIYQYGPIRAIAQIIEETIARSVERPAAGTGVRTVDITNYASGDTLQIFITLTDDDGSAVDIGGASIEYAVFDDGGTQQFNKTVSGGGITITDDSTGEFRIDVDPADTDGLSGAFDHECEMQLQGDTATLFQGAFQVTADQITP